MEREIIITKDGSSTIFIPELKEHYHSTRGAIEEADYVYLKMGLHHFQKLYAPKEVCILEIGFGTGLNALMTLLEAEKSQIRINYTTFEAFPVTTEEISQLNYPSFFPVKYAEKAFFDLHSVVWEKEIKISEFFNIKKEKMLFSEIASENQFDLIYFDAFAPRVQPELWTPQIFAKMYRALRKGGVLVTYSASGSVRRAMKETKFKVERLPGPPGKWEMLRGSK